MITRKAKPDDAKDVATLLLELINVSGMDEGKRTFLNEIAKGHNYIVAEEKGEVIGLVSWLMHGRAVHGLAELYHIVVSSKHRGKGVGDKLFNALVKDANDFYEKNHSKLRKLFAMTNAENKKAHTFYERMGMKKEAVLKNHFYNNRDEIVYSRFF